MSTKLQPKAKSDVPERRTTLIKILCGVEAHIEVHFMFAVVFHAIAVLLKRKFKLKNYSRTFFPWISSFTFFYPLEGFFRDENYE